MLSSDIFDSMLPSDILDGMLPSDILDVILPYSRQVALSQPGTSHNEQIM